MLFPPKKRMMELLYYGSGFKEDIDTQWVEFYNDSSDICIELTLRNDGSYRHRYYKRGVDFWFNHGTNYKASIIELNNKCNVMLEFYFDYGKQIKKEEAEVIQNRLLILEEI